MELALRVAKVTLRLIGWLLVGTLRALALALSALGGMGGYSHGMMQANSYEVEHWSRTNRHQQERLYRR